MTRRNIAIAVGVIILVFLAGYGTGRYGKPAKTVTEQVATVEVDTHKAESTHEAEVQKEGPVRTVTVTRWYPVACPKTPGEPVQMAAEVTTTQEKGEVIKEKSKGSEAVATTSNDTKTQSTVTVINEQPRMMLQGGAAFNTDLKPVWNVGASYRVAGPFWAGAAYHIDEKRVEARLSLTF